MIQTLTAEVESLKNQQNLNASKHLEELREENTRLKYRLNIMKRVSAGIALGHRTLENSLKNLRVIVFSEYSGRRVSLFSVYDEHQPATAAGLRGGNQDLLSRPRGPAVGPGAQPAGQVWRLPMQQRHGHGPGESSTQKMLSRQVELFWALMASCLRPHSS